MPQPYTLDRANTDLDGKYVFLLWCELGSMAKIARRLAAEGILSPRTGKKYNFHSIWIRIMVWLVWHPEDARPYYAASPQNAFALDDELWNRFIVGRAMVVLGNSSRLRFLEWVEVKKFQRYEYLWKERYGLNILHETQWKCNNCSRINEIEDEECRYCHAPIGIAPPRIRDVG